MRGLDVAVDDGAYASVFSSRSLMGISIASTGNIGRTAASTMGDAAVAVRMRRDERERAPAHTQAIGGNQADPPLEAQQRVAANQGEREV